MSRSVRLRAGPEVSHQTVANVLKRHGLAPAPERGKGMAWREFVRAHTEVLAAVDFFTAEVWTAGGLITYHVLVFMRMASRKLWIAGMTTSPASRWMEQMARNATFADLGFLGGCRYLAQDRDAKFCAAFDAILKSVGIEAVRLPARSPNLNAHCERWIRSVKAEVLSKMILFGERAPLPGGVRGALPHRAKPPGERQCDPLSGTGGPDRRVVW